MSSWVTIELRGNQFHCSVYDYYKTPRDLNLKEDEKYINANLWKHLLSAVECRTSEAALQILKDMSKEVYEFGPLSFAYQMPASEKMIRISCTLPALIEQVEQGISDKAEEKHDRSGTLATCSVM